MSVLIEKVLVLAISIIISVGALVVFVDEIIPLLKQILEVYRRRLAEPLRSCIDIQGHIPSTEMLRIWNTLST